MVCAQLTIVGIGFVVLALGVPGELSGGLAVFFSLVGALNLYFAKATAARYARTWGNRLPESVWQVFFRVFALEMLLAGVILLIRALKGLFA